MATRRMTFRLYPNKQIEQSLRYHRKLHKDLYNAASYNRFTQYQKFNHKVDYFEQQNCLPAFKEVWTEYIAQTGISTPALITLSSATKGLRDNKL